jgi:transcriptional regulator with XRE-family HTH domain
MAGESGEMTATDVVRSNVRRLRDENGLKQRELVPLFQAHGVEWDLQTVKAFENGRRGLSLDEFFGLLLSFRVGWRELLATEAQGAHVVLLDGAWGLEPGGLEEAMEGTLLERPDYADALTARAEDQERRQTARELERAAAALGVDVPILEYLSRRLWQVSYSFEAKQRFDRARASHPEGDAKTDRALRGHVTRSLMAELRAQLEDVEQLVAGGVVPKRRRKTVERHA